MREALALASVSPERVRMTGVEQYVDQRGGMPVCTGYLVSFDSAVFACAGFQFVNVIKNRTFSVRFLIKNNPIQAFHLAKYGSIKAANIQQILDSRRFAA